MPGIVAVAVAAGSTAERTLGGRAAGCDDRHGAYRTLEYAITKKREATELANNGGITDNSQQRIDLQDGTEAVRVVW